ncbi:hypothetical protein QJS66_05025 [Kocuria rhizophila]|nr:hypothetical protein QJS66_05025 [Kocuria rhizophila]
MTDDRRSARRPVWRSCVQERGAHLREALRALRGPPDPGRRRTGTPPRQPGPPRPMTSRWARPGRNSQPGRRPGTGGDGTGTGTGRKSSRGLTANSSGCWTTWRAVRPALLYMWLTGNPGARRPRWWGCMRRRGAWEGVPGASGYQRGHHRRGRCGASPRCPGDETAHRAGTPWTAPTGAARYSTRCSRPKAGDEDRGQEHAPRWSPFWLSWSTTVGGPSRPLACWRDTATRAVLRGGWAHTP